MPGFSATYLQVAWRDKTHVAASVYEFIWGCRQWLACADLIATRTANRLLLVFRVRFATNAY